MGMHVPLEPTNQDRAICTNLGIVSERCEEIATEYLNPETTGVRRGELENNLRAELEANREKVNGMQPLIGSVLAELYQRGRELDKDRADFQNMSFSTD